MPFRNLPWRIGIPFLLLVLGGSIALVGWMGWQLTKESHERFVHQARTNASFITRMKLPASERMANQLSEVLGVHVHFRVNGEWIPALDTRQTVHDLPADSQVHRRGLIEAIAVPLANGEDLILTRFAFSALRSVLQPRTFAVLLIFWVAALLLAWVVSRGLVQPLRHLAQQLPQIETTHDFADIPEALRKDEIGDLARAFLRTSQALQAEREQRLQAEKLAVLGRMSAALAHEIQNPISAIKMHAQLAALDGQFPSAELIETEADRISDLVNQWLFLSKPEPPATTSFALAPLLDQVIASQQTQAHHANVAITADIPPSLSLCADRRRITQVFNNLIQNAIQAMPSGGQLTLRATLQDNHLTLIIADTGKGFSPAALTHYSEFFYSEREGGMGIGLSVVSEIIKAHRGTFHVANQPGAGALITLTLPVTS